MCIYDIIKVINKIRIYLLYDVYEVERFLVIIKSIFLYVVRWDVLMYDDCISISIEI